jgi:hypothetical protein
VELTIDQWTVSGDYSVFIRQSLLTLPEGTSDAVKVETARAMAIRVVNLGAERARQQYATPGDLMSAIYRQKQSEVTRYQADLIKVADNYPLMKRRAERLGVPLATVAAEWSARAAAWLEIAGIIEDIRDDANEGLEVAETVAEMETILAEMVWPEP